MMKTEYVSIIKKLIAKGELNKAIALGIKITNSSSDVIVLSSRLENIQKKYSSGSITDAILNSEIVKISYAFLNFIDRYNDYNREVIQVSHDKYVNDIMNRFSFNLETFSRIKLKITDIDKSYDIHLKKITKWARHIKFKDSENIKLTKKVYVDLEYYVIPRRQQILSNEKTIIKIEEVIIGNQEDIVILGQPGAGKTTTIKHLIRTLLDTDNIDHSYNYINLIRLRELNGISIQNFPYFLMSNVISNLGISIKINTADKESNISFEIEFLKNAVLELLENLNVLIIFDGFDELSNQLKKLAIDQFRQMSSFLNKSKIILTSRTGDYDYHVDTTKEFEIKSLNEGQIKYFTQKWIDNPKKANDLFEQIRISPFYDTAVRPLTLAHLCAIFERYSKIPDKPKTVYRKTVNLLIEEWDLQRSIVRKSKFSKFDIDRKFEFLSNLAFILTTSNDSFIFDKNEIISAYSDIAKNFSLPLNEGRIVFDEIESHTGIFVQSGYDKFEFPHKSIQEYLTAEYIVKLPIIPFQKKLLTIPSEFAIAVGISSNPTYYLIQLVFGKFRHLPLTNRFLKSFLDRLVLEKPDFYSDPLLAVCLLYLDTFRITLGVEDYIWKYLKLAIGEVILDESFKLLSKYCTSTYYIENKYDHSNVNSFYASNMLTNIIDIKKPIGYVLRSSDNRTVLKIGAIKSSIIIDYPDHVTCPNTIFEEYFN